MSILHHLLLTPSSGEVYVHPELGVEAGGEVDQGDCGIRLLHVHPSHGGAWTCRSLKQAPQLLLKLHKFLKVKTLLAGWW